jgi:membrane-associated phospholipid phosphatase
MINSLLKILYKSFFYIGGYGPFILILCSIYLLRKKETLLFYYLIGIFLNSILNLILKSIIKQPRPNEDSKKFELALKQYKNTFNNGIPFEIFGMPSGHAQSALFSTTFIYLSLRNKNILWFFLVISLITIFQRVQFGYHFISQVIMGSIIGIVFSYYIYYLVQDKLKGKIREKKDDYGPI